MKGLECNYLLKGGRGREKKANISGFVRFGGETRENHDEGDGQPINIVTRCLG